MNFDDAFKNALLSTLPEVKAAKEAEKLVKAELREIECGRRPIPEVTYQDPEDLSPLNPGYESYLIRYKYGTGFDAPGSLLRPNGMPYFSQWYMSLYYGNYTEIVRMITSIPTEDRNKLLKKREGMSKLCAIFLPVIGARSLHREGVPKQPYFEYRHIEVLELLIKLGANVRVPDLVGCTALHHCFVACNDVTYKLALKLLEAGADPNAPDRFLETPIFNAARHQDMKAVQILMDHKANPYLKDFNGKTVFALFDMNTHPEMIMLLRKNDAYLAEKKRKVAKQENDFKKCRKCKKDASKRCTGCFLVWYCSSDCQRSDWRDHKVQECHKISDGYEEVEIDVEHSESHAYQSLKTGKIHNCSFQAKKSSFVVNISVTRVLQMACQDKPLLLYNKDRDVQFSIKSKSSLAKKLTNIIINNDKTNVYKGYFYCVTKQGKYYVNPTILPDEKW